MRTSRRKSATQSSPALRLRDYLVTIAVVLAVCFGALGFAWWQQWRLAQRRGVDPALLLPSQDIALSVGSIIAFECYLAWAMVFFTRIRPWLAEWLGERLGVTIREQRRTKHWELAPPAEAGVGLLIALADIFFLLLGTMGPFTLGLGALLLLLHV